MMVAFQVFTESLSIRYLVAHDRLYVYSQNVTVRLKFLSLYMLIVDPLQSLKA